MAEKIWRQEDSLYETPRIDVIEMTTSDVVRTSNPDGMESGAGDNGAWWN